MNMKEWEDCQNLRLKNIKETAPPTKKPDTIKGQHESKFVR